MTARLDASTLIPGFFLLKWFRRVNRKGLIDVKAAVQHVGQPYLMPFYRFQVCDPIIPIDGHGHDGAALGDDIDATLFAAGIIQRFFQEHRAVPRNWAVKITQDSRRVSVLPFEAGLKVLVRPYWTRELSMIEAPEAKA